MAFFIRRPFAVTSALHQIPKFSSNTARFISTSPIRSAPLPKQVGASTSIFAKSRQGFQNAFRRTYMQQTFDAQSGSTGQKLAYGAAIVGGTVLVTNFLFNRETREDGGMPAYERSFLNETFMHTGLGLGMIAIAARTLHTSGWTFRLMSMNPWVVMGVGLVGSFGSMYATRATSPDNYVVKYGFWSLFNITQAALLAPLMFYNPALLARAGIYTVGMMGSIAFVGATAKQEKYLYLGGPLLAGVAVVALSGLAPLVLPVTAARTLMWSERIWLYGGLAVFGGFTLYDVQKVLHHARLAERGIIQRDVVNETISLELDFLNIFIRMVQILSMQQNRRR
ncbi:hypothetical protein N7468_005162 [Penicillium chermesinum]|uniref:Uncharacterized protein n=1 Tax=Penicillium chermesinum TaxID=63820 RepID=A0A9W9TMQ1_9EURO|nr:uncharacterized protein N7468_005162 [Penicillium chermesinum]KAJ5232206.1 hypothetical protein N7468_005162 [Penicillium chermesinum]